MLFLYSQQSWDWFDTALHLFLSWAKSFHFAFFASSLHFVPESLILRFPCLVSSILVSPSPIHEFLCSLSIHGFLVALVSFLNTSYVAFRITCLVFVHLSLIIPTTLSPVLTSLSLTAFWKSSLVFLSFSFPVLHLSVLVTFFVVLNLRVHFIITGLWSLSISVLGWLPQSLIWFLNLCYDQLMLRTTFY